MQTEDTQNQNKKWCFVNQYCIGCGICVSVTEERNLFKMENGKSIVLKQPDTQADIASFKVAQIACPVAAIEGEPKIEK